MEMEPLPGYEYASWETGYGDFRMIPDMSTLRLVPWLEKTAMVLCDIADEETGEPVTVSPRQILRDQIAKAAEMGYTVKTGSELEFYLFQDSYGELAERGYETPRPSRARTSWTTTCSRPPRTSGSSGRSATACWAPRIPVEFSKGEFGKGQHEINITY